MNSFIYVAQGERVAMLYETPLSERTSENSPFAVLYEVREPLKPKSKSSNGWARRKAKKLADAARNPDSVEQKTAKVLRVNKYSELGVSTVFAGERAASIRKSGVC